MHVLVCSMSINSIVAANGSVLVEGSDATGTLHAVYTLTQLLQYYSRQAVAVTPALAEVQQTITQSQQYSSMSLCLC
jgi:hypothetical protein